MASPLSGSVAVMPIVDSAGSNQPFYAPASGGGGGGGGGTDPSFSTITMNNGGAIYMNYNGGVGANIQFDTDNANNYTLLMAYPSFSMAPNTVSSMTGTKPSLINQNGVFDGLQCGGIIFDGNGQGSTAVTPAMAGDVNGNLNVWASNVSISSMTVSSINGASPSGGGGGGGPNLVCSTLTATDSIATSTINTNTVYGLTGTLSLASGGSGFTFWEGNNGTFIKQNNQKVIELNGSASAPGQCLFNNFSVVNMANTGLLVSSINGQVPGTGGGAPPAVVSTISSLVNVSTINGAPYPPTSGGSVFSSINIPGGPGSAFNADPNVVTQILSIPIIPNHVYSVDVNARVIANNAPPVSATDNYYLELVANGGSTQALNTAWGVQVSTLTSGSVYTEVGGTAIFKAPVNAVSTLLLNALGTFSTTTRVDSFSYIDFGAI